MSKRAKAAAMNAYPIHGEWVGNQYGGWDRDINSPKREVYQQGYEQAEKDTIERALDWLKYGQDKKMSFDGAIAYFKAIMEEE